MISSFRLSDPGSLQAIDPSILEYLRSYRLPLPPAARYGFSRFASPQEKYQVLLHSQAWVPSHANGTVLLLHGYSEHSANYARLIRDLVEAQLAVITLDFRGHGLSEGPSGHVPFSHTYAEDAETVLGQIFPATLPNRPLFVFGHSMGAMVGLQLLLRNRLPVAPAGAVFTSPLLGFPELSGTQKVLSRLAPTMARFAPSLPISHGVRVENLSHDESYLSQRVQDPLIRKVTTPRWFMMAKEAVAELQSKASHFQKACPTLLMLAGEERITNLLEARRFAFQAYAGQQHKVVEFPGMFHELEKEESIRDRVVSETVAWFRDRY